MPQDLTYTKLTKALAWTAAALFAASWFLPVLDDVPGWMAFRYALAPLVPFRDRDAGSVGWEDSAPQLMSALTNLVFVLLFALWAALPTLRYWDGRHDNWYAGTRDEPWPIFAA